MILPLFLWITRQKGAREGARWHRLRVRSGQRGPPQTAGQGRAVADRISATRPPLGPRYVTENSAVPGERRTAAKARKCQLGGGCLRRIRGKL